MNPTCSQRCPWCSAPLALVWVHGHGQCSRCGINVDECCRGELAPVERERPKAPAGPPARAPEPR